MFIDLLIVFLNLLLVFQVLASRFWNLWFWVELRILGIHLITNSPNLEIGLNFFLFRHLQERCHWREEFFKIFLSKTDVLLVESKLDVWSPDFLRVRNLMCLGLIYNLDTSPFITCKSWSYLCFSHLSTFPNNSLAKNKLSFQISFLWNKTLRCTFQVLKYLKIISLMLSDF